MLTTYNNSHCQAHLLADTLKIPLMYNPVFWNNFQKKKKIRAKAQIWKFESRTFKINPDVSCWELLFIVTSKILSEFWIQFLTYYWTHYLDSSKNFCVLYIKLFFWINLQQLLCCWLQLNSQSVEQLFAGLNTQHMHMKI